MVLLIVTVFAAVLVIADARPLNAELYEIRDRAASRSRNQDPVLRRISKLDSKTNAAAFAGHVLKYFTLFKPNDGSDSSESEGGFVDETRSSIVLVPRDDRVMYDIVKSANKADQDESIKIYQLFQDQPKEHSSYGKRTKRKALEPQWEIPMIRPS